MKRINEYKKLFNVEGSIDLKDLKKEYRNLVKEWHPDKFQDESQKEDANTKSLKIIDGYHFLVSIAPETKAANLSEYNKTIATSKIVDFQHKKQVFEVTFEDGTTYEYFGVNEKLFSNFVNSDKRQRFAKRKIFESFIYRKSKKDTVD